MALCWFLKSFSQSDGYSELIRIADDCLSQPHSGFIIPACAGETWGLYFSDYEDELRQLLEESTERWLLLTRMCAGHDTLILTAGTSRATRRTSALLGARR